MISVRDRLLTAGALLALMLTGLSAESPEPETPGCHDDPFINGANLWRAVDEANSNGADDDLTLLENCEYRLRSTLMIGPDPTPAGNPGKLRIRGQGAWLHRVPASDASQPFRVVDIAPEAFAEIDAVTVSGGRTVEGDGGGAGVRVGPGATLILSNSTIHHNASPDSGGGLAVAADGAAGVVFSTIRDNKSGPTGSAIEGAGRIEMASSTVSANIGGGGSVLRVAATTTMANVTFTDNEGFDQVFETAAPGGQLFLYGATVARNGAKGILNQSQATVRSSIVADNDGPNCSGNPVAGERNLTDDGSCPGATGSRLLGPLQDNGGPTPTRALKQGSAAINPGSCPAGEAPNGAAAVDQRGVPRDANCDIGATEFVDSDGDGTDDGAESADSGAG